MEPETDLTFGPFRLDVTRGQLWQGEQSIPLRRRSLAMLRYLAEHAGRLVTKTELRQHVWAGTHVTDTVLRVCVQEIRAALDDAAAAPRYLATVGRQGYRFLVGDDQDVAPALLAGPFVGRQGEMDTLASWFRRATQGIRQLVFVSGSAGVGKTAVVERWLAGLTAGNGTRIAWGQCVEHYGEGEPYLPLLEALGQLIRGPDHRDLLDTVRRYAPMWLVQLPGLLSETELERLQRQVQGAHSARMLREIERNSGVFSSTMHRPLGTDAARDRRCPRRADRRDPAGGGARRSAVERLPHRGGPGLCRPATGARAAAGAGDLSPGRHRDPAASAATHGARPVRARAGDGTAPGVAHQRGCDGLSDRTLGRGGVHPTRGRRL